MKEADREEQQQERGKQTAKVRGATKKDGATIGEAKPTQGGATEGSTNGA